MFMAALVKLTVSSQTQVQVERKKKRDFSSHSHLILQMQVEAERKKRAAILESEGIRESEINVAQGKKAAAILASEGRLLEREMDSSLPLHYGLDQPRIHTEVLGHSLVRSLVCLHYSLIRLLCTTCFARALHCTLTSLTPSLVGQ